MIDTSTGELICGRTAVYMQPRPDHPGQYHYLSIQCLRDFQHEGVHEDDEHWWHQEGNVKLKEAK